MMENLLGLLRVRVIRGNNLAIRDVRSSDPYVVIKMGKQKLKTRVVSQNLNPEWNEDLTLCVSDPNHMVKLVVYDHDRFSLDDKMGEAEFDIKPFLEAVKMGLEGLPSGTVVTRVIPSRKNCLAEESCVMYKDGKVVQDMCLRLQNVECGEVELLLQWIDLPGSKGMTIQQILVELLAAECYLDGQSCFYLMQIIDRYSSSNIMDLVQHMTRFKVKPADYRLDEQSPTTDAASFVPTLFASFMALAVGFFF